MDSEGKFITGEITSSHGMPIATAVCFSNVVEHIAVAPVFSEIWGAGFFTAHDGVVIATGKSLGLGIESRGSKDERMICMALGLPTQRS